ncbi:type VI secretion system-associated protein TagO [Enterovibrio makurazakiensis]|uniref:Type VI secretion system-associated protein TagO n=1 Tax=Enterovibrio gelatinilyticus TaxID=2899819 RepID=A0ABT5R0V5_9GAMM|nr:type VI secretion system-associated protein VasI [Enterovibrio sp. ZSDZ42]MDD1793391.1 type VI secretion system-associated protein TagO [Enterovibrio sp. ZSDZ42]
MRLAKTMVVGSFVFACWLSPITVSAKEDSDGKMAASEVLVQAKVCADIFGRLERLACFDNLFNTPVKKATETTFVALKPEAWQRATRSERDREEDGGFVLRYVDMKEPKSGMWMTATALPDRNQQRSEMPILMFSCIDNISRVELVLPTATSAGKAAVTTSASSSVTQRWLSDDTGNIMRAGRGLPAIEVMSALMSGPRAVVRSDLDAIGNLTFDTSTLKKTIAPMRQVCRW